MNIRPRGIVALFLMGTAVLTSRAAAPDLTASGVIATIDRTYTYNLGPTGLRGWIYVGGGNGADGTITVESRQILVTVATTPGSAVLAVDDVILGAMAGSSGTVPLFTSDCRKAFGAAIGEAEKSGAGTLRVKRWRAGATSDENIAMPVMGNYTATAPYSCPKSALILSNACNKLVSQLLADSTFLDQGQGFSRPIHALALLSGIALGDPNYTTVQTRLQTYARELATTGSLPTDQTWFLAYSCLFLSEYYLATSDANVLAGINNFTVALAQAQSIYGTFGHGSAALAPDGSGRRYSTGYGPVNQVGIPATMALVMGKKALLAGGQTPSAELDPAIYRGNAFFSWFVNKGPIGYGEHAPWMGNHESNGKDPACAVLFGLQSGRTNEAAFFTRMAIAGFNSRESGHTGQGFSYLWSALGANVGGSLATAEYLKNVRWHLDLSRRTDGSFTYDGQEGCGPGTTEDGTYLGKSSYNDLLATASYILTYSVPLQRLYITGKNALPDNTLDSAKVAHAISSATFKQECPGFTVAQLTTALSDFDPLVRHYAALELGTRSPSSGELTTLRTMVTGTNANGRMGACQALGLLQDAAALPMLIQRLDRTSESNSWVRAKAASAIRSYSSATMSTYRDELINAFMANATNPDVIDWDDPVQISNGYLSQAVFGNGVPDGTPGNDIAAYTINASTNLLYPALSIALKQPDSYPRTGVGKFCYDRLSLTQVQALIPSLFRLVQSEGQADRMWGAPAREYGINTLAKYKIQEGVSLFLPLLEVPAGFEWDAYNYINPALNAMVAYGDAARWVLPTLTDYQDTWDPNDPNGLNYQQAYPVLVSAVAAIENAITAPAQNLGLAVADAQVVVTTNAKAITLTGMSPRLPSVTFTNVTMPAHGTLTGTAPNLTYTPAGGYAGPDHFTFQVSDGLTTSTPGTVSLLVGTIGAGLKGEYFNNADFTSLQLTRTDSTINFDWETGSPHALLGADTFSVRWSGVLLVPETGTYTFSTLNSDGVRLYVNGVAVINQFADQEINWNDSGSFSLTEGQWVELQMDYYENTNSAMAKLKWTGPSFAGSNGVIIGTQWLYDGTGMPRTLYAFPQSLTLLKNAPHPVTLTGSAGTLTYSVVTPPAHGSLSGIAPNLAYTPAPNYIGLDSFTFKVNSGTTDSAPATVSIDVIPGNTFSVNFYVGPEWPYGGLTTDEQKANVMVNAGVSAGLADWFTYGWRNFLVPWGLSAPLGPVTLTSNQGSPATFTFKNCRNGYTYDGPRTTLLGDGNGNMMDAHVNSTLDGPYPFDMEVTDIPFALYDVIFYMGANAGQYGDGTGVIKFNGTADQAFTLKPGAFDGTFAEMVDGTTPGNYVIFRGVTGSSFTAQTWGTGPGGFNHIGPCGFQIREIIVMPQTITIDALAPKTYGDAPFALTATASSGLPVSYTSSDTNVATVAGATVTILKAGTTVITASQAGSGNYYAATNVFQPLTVNPRPVLLAGTRIYDGTAGIPAAGLSITNKVSGDDLTLSGSASLVGKDAGPQAVTNATGFATPARVQSATGNTGTATASSLTVTLGAAPAKGNTLVAVIATRGTSANRVSTIGGGGVTWSRASQAANANSTTTEIWYGPNVSSGTPAITISQATLRSAAVVMEYSGILAASPLDQLANATGNSASAATGTTPSTTQAGELWIGGIGLTNSTHTLTSPLNGFIAFTNAASTSGTAGRNAKVYVLEKVVTTNGTANTGGTISTTAQWSGAIATFKTASTNSLTLSGAASTNYTLTGMSGTMTITPKPLTLAGTTVTNKIYDATVTATFTNGTLLAAEAPGAGTTSDGKPYTGDAVGVTLSGFFDTKDVGVGKPVTSTSSLAGAQAGNYTLTQPAGLTGAITDVPLTVTASDQSKNFGQDLTFGSGSTLFTSSGLVASETIGTVTLACTGGDAVAAAGTYAITPSAAIGGTFTPANYVITYLPGTLTVNAMSQTITFGPLAAKTYGDAPFSLAATASSLLAVSYESSDTSVATLSGSMVTILKAGTTTITATQAGNINYAAATPVPQTLTVGKAIVFLAEDFEDEWDDNALARSTNNWTSSGLFDQSSITNPAVGYDALPSNVIFPLTYDHSSRRRVLKLDTQGDSLHTPALAAVFAASRIYVDMMLKFSVSETLPAVPLNADCQKTALLLLANGVTTNLLVLHGQKTSVGFGDPIFATLPGNLASENWYRLTLTFDATADNGGAEAFSVRVNGEPLVSPAAYSDSWKTRIFSESFTPDVGSWFLSTARRMGVAGTDQTVVTGIGFDGTCLLDDLVVTAEKPTFTPGTLILLALSTGSGSEAWMGYGEVLKFKQMIKTSTSLSYIPMT